MSFLQKLNTLLRLGLLFERNSSVYTARNTIVLERFLVTPPAKIIEHFKLCVVLMENCRVPVLVQRCLFIYELRYLVNFLVVCLGDNTFFILFILLQ